MVRSGTKARTATEAATVAEAGGEAPPEASLDFEPITLVCRNLRYFVDAPAGERPSPNVGCGF